MKCRKKYIFSKDSIPKSNSKHKLKCIDGVFFVYDTQMINSKVYLSEDPLIKIETRSKFLNNYHFISKLADNEEVRKFCSLRLEILEKLFHFFELVNGKYEQITYKTKEETDSKKSRNSVSMYDIEKCDNYLILKYALNKGDLINYMEKEKEKLIQEDSTFQESGSLNLNYFISKYFNFTDQYPHFSKLLNKSFNVKPSDHNQLFECVVDINGTSPNEWETLASFIKNNGLANQDKIRLIINLPPLYHEHKHNKLVQNFEELLINFFEPLFKATESPESYPILVELISQISGFSTILEDKPGSMEDIPPKSWSTDNNPGFLYYLYYIWANVRSLNALRVTKGLSPFLFKPVSSGRNRDYDHLYSTFLVSDCVFLSRPTISKSPVMQFLFYLTRVGLITSLMYSNHLAHRHFKNPFQVMFKRGLRVSLASHSPTIFHISKDALGEEYSIVTHMWKFGIVDNNEMCKNSIINSGFIIPGGIKSVPEIRQRYRKVTHEKELDPFINPHYKPK
uniref:Uncharacterized protein n=1 Tax=Arcella intermedia TaxID=1963864 RepID=A0A6B2L1V5_9EUKA